ncbi:MAG: PEP-CTERM sorting domain-containing protein [Fimbriimonadaceae bacterium]
MRTLFTFAALSALAVAASAQAVIESSTFDSDADNWFKVGSDTVTYSATGGNPDGHMAFQDDQSGQTDLVNETQFAGDYASWQVTGLVFDHIVKDKGDGFENYLPYRVVLSGGGNQATWQAVTTSDAFVGLWETVNVPIDVTSAGADWTVNSGTWAGLMSNVERVAIRMELVTSEIHNGTDQEGLDNIKLEAVPEPATMLALGAGLAALAARRRKK